MQADIGTTSRAAVSREPAWEAALNEVMAKTALGPAAVPDLALLFASYHHRGAYERLVSAAAERTGARLLAGCSGQGIIGPSAEIESAPALSLMQVRLEGASLTGIRLTQDTLADLHSGGALVAETGLAPSDVNAWMILADPFRLDVERMLGLMEQGYPGRPLVGGLASAGPAERSTCVFLNGSVFDEGAVAIAVAGGFTVRTLVSQGATPIGQPWTITGAHENVVESIGGRPAYEVLVETVQALPEDMRRRAVPNLLVGLAMDEYRETHSRGDFLIRNLAGADRETGALAIAAYPRVGQTIQFQMRDGQAADEELVEMVRAEHETLAGLQPAAALLCSCNGRGVGLFGVPNHDVQRIEEGLGPVPLAGFFCNGEIGPVGGKTFLHGFTASLALLMPTVTGERGTAG